MNIFSVNIHVTCQQYRYPDLNGLLLDKSAQGDSNHEYEALHVTLYNYILSTKHLESADFGILLQPR